MEARSTRREKFGQKEMTTLGEDLEDGRVHGVSILLHPAFHVVGHSACVVGYREVSEWLIPGKKCLPQLSDLEVFAFLN